MIKNRVITINKFLKNIVLNKVGLTSKTCHLNRDMFITCLSCVLDYEIEIIWWKKIKKNHKVMFFFLKKKKCRMTISKKNKTKKMTVPVKINL
jgi:hypothetical protein